MPNLESTGQESGKNTPTSLPNIRLRQKQVEYSMLSEHLLRTSDPEILRQTGNPKTTKENEGKA